MVVDTTIFIEYLRAKKKENTAYWNIPNETEVYISVVTLYELYIGANTPEKEQEVSDLADQLNILPMTQEISEEASAIYRDLRKRNKIIGHRDIFIAATTKVHGFRLKTNNQKHFSRVSDLDLA